MPIIFQHTINEKARVALWKIEEPLSFFAKKIPVPDKITHPDNLLRHMAARYLLHRLEPDFPYDKIRISDSGKPFLSDDSLHFSLSHSGNYAAAIISKGQGVGVDTEVVSDRIFRVGTRFLSEQEWLVLQNLVQGFDEKMVQKKWLTAAWSAKESVFKWQGKPGVDFKKDIKLQNLISDRGLGFLLNKTKTTLEVQCRFIEEICLTWVIA